MSAAPAELSIHVRPKARRLKQGRLIMDAWQRRDDHSTGTGPTPSVIAASEQLVSPLAERACMQLECDRAAALLFERRDPRLCRRVAEHSVALKLDGAFTALEQDLAGRVIAQGESLIVEDCATLGGVRARGLQAAAVPMVVDGAARGVFVVLATHERERFGADDLERLADLGHFAAIAVQNAEMRADLTTMLDSGVQAMALAVEMRDGYTGCHSEAVVELACEVGARMGIAGDALVELEFAARLHDVGKIAVPDAILRKEGALDDDEWQVMKRHPVWGSELLAQIPQLAAVSMIVRSEHERWDGSGYPDRLRGSEIPLASRIILACDAYHAMTSDRPYRRAMSPARAAAELRSNAGTQFDPATVDALLQALVAKRSIAADEHAPVA